MDSNSELQNLIAGCQRRPKYGCEIGERRGVRTKGKCNMGWYMTGGGRLRREHSYNREKKGMVEERSDLQELNGSR